MEPVEYKPFINNKIPTNAHKVILSFFDPKDLAQRIFPLCRSARLWNTLKLENSKIVVLSEPKIDFSKLNSISHGWTVPFCWQAQDLALRPTFPHWNCHELHTFSRALEHDKSVIDQNSLVQQAFLKKVVFMNCPQTRMVASFEPTLKQQLRDVDQFSIEEDSKTQQAKDKRMVCCLFTQDSDQAVVWQKVNAVWKQQWTLSTSDYRWTPWTRVNTILMRGPNLRFGQGNCFYDIINNFQLIPLSDSLANFSGDISNDRHHLLFFKEHGKEVTVLHKTNENGKTVIGLKWRWVLKEDKISEVQDNQQLVFVRTDMNRRYLLDAKTGVQLFEFSGDCSFTALKGGMLFYQMRNAQDRLHCINPFTNYRAIVQLPCNDRVLAIMHRMYPWTAIPAERQILIFQAGLKEGTQAQLKFSPLEDS